MNAFTVGCVPYLNGKPLVCGLEQEATVVYEPPSRLAGLLARGAVQVALAPAFHLCSSPGVIVDVGAIVTHGPAESVLLFHRVPPPQIRRLAVNAHSRTSNALAHLVLDALYQRRPEVKTQEPDLERMLATADAAVLIGDYALAMREAPHPRIDLGQAWNALTGLPMVWAVWAAADSKAAATAEPLLARAKERGLARLPEIAEEHSRTSGLAAPFCLRYLAQTMRYDFGALEREALEEFHRRCRRAGLR